MKVCTVDSIDVMRCDEMGCDAQHSDRRQNTDYHGLIIMDILVIGRAVLPTEQDETRCNTAYSDI